MEHRLEKYWKQVLCGRTFAPVFDSLTLSLPCFFHNRQMKTTYLKGIKQAEILFMECKQWQWPVERWNLNNEMLYSDTMNHFSPGNVCFQTTREVWEALEIFDLDYRIIDNRNVQSSLQGDQIMDNSKGGDYMYINRIWKIIVLLL